MLIMDFKGKKIAVIGAGVEGLSSLEFFSKKEALLFILDQKNENEIKRDKLDRIKGLGAKIITGKNYLSSLSDFDIIVRSPGVRRDLPEIVRAEKRGAVVTSQTKLFFDLCPAKIIGVTGTKGKGTTSSLIYEILKQAGREVFLGGNIGKPPLDLIDELTKESIVVLELSSFQLIDLDKSPYIAVILMITSEHLDWHKSPDEYFKAKETIVKFQNENDSVVMNADFEQSKKIGDTSLAKKYYFSTKSKIGQGAFVDEDQIVSTIGSLQEVVKISDIKIPGEHNLQNVAAATLVAEILKIPVDAIRSAVRLYKGLPHRLELIAEKNGVPFYNDSASTNPETTIAAILAFKNPKILILGGSSKNSNFDNLGKAASNENVKAVILVGQEAIRIKQSLERANFKGQIVENVEEMQGVVGKAVSLANMGDVVILSPACASFDQYKNYIERGEKFKQAVREL
ncbi:MAG: UDP-N-acetylmuramoylalanine--D-glutamate ligase [Candidatus Woykebacteria bacterium RBG_13_40_15]|uniref:UDP-N-acetylmuramoylalanine--D-glutamate ligase n=1 Tax=Candidatus Woykebacteria bacterium RBG_13_40_15 TaxID=1802593 RepID=A0A1G1W9D4_9BACT|nr:MAG: UDP-N-acetylmuramoylalanine--D-glutamate ligase [Candidatus Woykebacteria bacterium RBG_13_40_15]